MGCNSGSVDDAVKANIEAKKAVKKLQEALEHDKDSIKAKFFAEIDDSFADANITDGRQIGYSYDIKTEYTSEFSLDKISGVVLSALQAAIAAQDPTAKTPGTHASRQCHRDRSVGSNGQWFPAQWERPVPPDPPPTNRGNLPCPKAGGTAGSNRQDPPADDQE